MENGKKVNKINISQKIPLYPLNGHSNYLIDKFYIFGYDSSTLTKYLLNNNNIKNFVNEKKQNEENKFQKFQIEELPTLLNEFTSDYEKECLEIDMIREMILPNKINLYYLEEEKTYSKSPEKRRKREHFNYKKSDSFQSDKNEENFTIYDEDDFTKREVPPSYNVIFSSNPQSGNNSKKSINGFAYIFYKKLKAKKDINKNSTLSFYAPIIFCIISEFPYYNSFYQLCMQIEELFSNNELRIPLEIIIYSLITLSPSPLNGEVTISLKSLINYGNEGKSKMNNIINETIEETNEDNENITTPNKVNIIQKEMYNNNINKNVSLKRNSDIKYAYRLSSVSNSNVLKHLKTIGTSKNYRDNNNINNVSDEDNEKKFKKIKFDFLTGYPVIQYNLAKVLLQNLTPLDVIDIFFYTFLEKDVLFFSKDLEFLSLTINSYLNLNFPLNDEKYYFINACVSYESYLKGDSTFVGSTFTTMIGINSAYNPKYQSDKNNKLKEHLAVDLDNGKVYKVEDKNDLEKSRKNKELFTFIKNICKNRENSNMTNILYREINILNNVLTDLYSKMKERISSEEYNIYYNIYRINSYISYDKNIKDINLKIQDSFYRFINNISLYFYQNLSIKSESDDNRSKKLLYDNIEGEMNVIFLKDDDNYSKEELILLEELTETMKFQSFVYGFVQSYNPTDLHKIPSTFTEEFLSIISRKSGILDKEINFLSLIDKLYGIDSEGEINIDLEPILIDYYTNYKSYFDREIEDNCTKYALYPEKIKIKTYSHYKKIIKYKGYELDDRILNKYLHLLNELNEKKDNIFFRLKAMVKANIPKTISVTSIESIIEEYAMETKILSPSDFCCANILILFTLSLRHLKSVNLSYFLGMLLNSFTVFRKYYSMILSMIYIIVEESLKKKDYNNVEKHLNLYYLCINSLRNYKLIPNENLMNMIKKFNKIDLKSLPANTNLNNTEDKPDNLQVYKITPKNLYITHNFTSIRIYHEKEIVQKVNDRSNDDDFFKCNEEKLLQPKIKYREGVELHQSLFYSQKTILSSLNEEYKNYIIDRDENKFGEKIILDACLNIIIFMRNTEAFSKENDIIETVVMIFNIFMNKFLQVKKNS